MRLTFDCAVIDRQSYLDGTRELTLEGEGAGPVEEPWQLTLTVRWPKDEAPDEGDVSITRGNGAALYAGLRDGIIRETADEGGDMLLEMALSFEIASAEGELSGMGGRLGVEGTIAGIDATLVVTVADA